MHREHERRRKASEDQIRHLVVLPVPVAAAPANGCDAVGPLFDLRFCTVAQHRKVGDESDVPEEHRHGEIRRDCEHVPQQRRAVILPQAVPVRNREKIPRLPNATDVEAGIETGAHHREERHRFGCAVDGRAPLLPREEKDRRDERARVADADPEDEVRDVPRPAERLVFTPHTDAV